MKIVLVDMDGVLAAYGEGFQRAWQARHPDLPVVPHTQQTSFYLEEQYPDEHASLVQAIQDSEGFYRNLPVVPGAVEALNLLDAIPGVRVFLCSSPSISAYQYCVPEKYQWVDEHFGEKFVRRIILTKDKTLVKGKYLIDDKPTVKGVDSPSWEHVVFDRPYNQEAAGRRLDGWHDLGWLVAELLPK